MDRVTGYYHYYYYYYYYYSPVLPPVAGLARDPNVVPPPVSGFRVDCLGRPTSHTSSNAATLQPCVIAMQACTRASRSCS